MKKHLSRGIHLCPRRLVAALLLALGIAAAAPGVASAAAAGFGAQNLGWIIASFGSNGKATHSYAVAHFARICVWVDDTAERGVWHYTLRTGLGRLLYRSPTLSGIWLPNCSPWEYHPYGRVYGVVTAEFFSKIHAGYVTIETR
jgi:hypothetical protein